MSEVDLWSLFLHRREECSREFWAEVENRKAAGTLSKDCPFWTMGNVGRLPHVGDWEARKPSGLWLDISHA